MSLTDVSNLERKDSGVQPVLGNIDYPFLIDNRSRTSHRVRPPRLSLFESRARFRPKSTRPRRLPTRKYRRESTYILDKAIKFDEIAKTYLKCENKFIEALRKSKMSIDEKLDLIVKKRDECSQSQSDIVDEEMNGGRRKRRRKTRRKKKRKSRRKSRKRKRKTKRRR